MHPDELFSPNSLMEKMKGAPYRGIVKLSNTTPTRGGAPVHKHNTTTTKSARVKEQFTLKNATIFGGANILADYAEAVGLSDLLAGHLAFAKAPYATFALHETLAALVLATVLGHSRIFHLAGLENDPLLCLKTGWDKLPDHTTFNHDLHRFATEEQVASLRPVLAALARRIPGASCILDFDSTVETLYGSQQGAAVGYNTAKHGRKSYHPLLVFDGVSQAMLNGILRPGNAVSATGFAEFLHQTLALYPGLTVDFIRMDAGFAGEEIYALAEKHARKGYVAKIRQFSALMDKAVLFPWRRVEYTDYIAEVKSFTYQAKDWSKPRRIVMVRYRPADGQEQGGQLRLAELDWHTAAMVTNLDWAEEDVWHFYNQRCCQENYIKEMKDGIGMDQIPAASFTANHAMMLLKGIAYNLAAGFRKEVGTPRFSCMTLARLRREFLMIPAKLVRHARQTVLKLAANFRFRDDYHLMRLRLEALV